jgi:ABC-2 type transport system permease protein
MKSLRHIWVIAVKDMTLFARDRTALFFNLLFPFLFVALFATVMSGFGSEDPRLVLRVATLEGSGSLSHLIARAVETDNENELEPGEPLIVWEHDYDDALQAVMDGRSDGFLVFPEGFTEAISRTYGTHIEVVSDPDATYVRAALTSMADSIAYQLGLQQVVRGSITGLMVESWLAQSPDSSRITAELPEYLALHGGAPMRPSLIEYKVEEVGRVEAEEPADYVIPGYLVMFVFIASASCAELIVRERKNYTMERLLAASVRKESIILGTFAGIAAKALVQVAVFWTAGILIFNMSLGRSPGAVIILSLLLAVMSAAFAVMLATLAPTQRSAASIAVVTSLVLAALGGCWWPLFITPRWMQFIAKFTPHGWATTGFNKLILFGAEPAAVMPEMLALVGFGVLFSVIALLRFRTSAA